MGAIFDVPTRKIPDIGIVIAFGVSMTEQYLATAAKNRCRHNDRWSTISHPLILVQFELATQID